jgi:hypothetical protein
LLESLGHHVEHGFPPPWQTATSVVASRLCGHEHGCRGTSNESQLGRVTNDDDIEAVNRAQVEFARNVSGVDYALALAANVEFRRAVQQWWAAAGICCSHRRSPSRQP